MVLLSVICFNFANFELENVSTFNPDQKLHSYHLVKRDGFSEALVTMFEKDSMVSFLNSKQECALVLLQLRRWGN